MTFKLNRNQLKYLVIVAMLIDHIAWAFVPTVSVLGFVMHFIGRLTGPTMAFFLVEGFEHTRDRKKYLMRLGIFALISWIPFSLFELGRITYSFGVIYTLFLGLIALMVEERQNLAPWKKILLFFILLRPVVSISKKQIFLSSKCFSISYRILMSIISSLIIISISVSKLVIYRISQFFSSNNFYNNVLYKMHRTA